MNCTKPNCDCAELAELKAGGPVKSYPCLVRSDDVSQEKTKRHQECQSGNCEITQSPDYKVIKPMPFPTKEDLKDPFFNALFQIVYKRRFTCPEYYEGWQVGTGRHAKIIFDQIKEVK